MSSRRDGKPRHGDDDLPLRGRLVMPRPAPPPAPVRQPQLLLVLVPAFVGELVLAGLALSQGGGMPATAPATAPTQVANPAGGAVFSVIITALLGYLAYRGQKTTRYILAALWFFRGTVALGAAIARPGSPAVYALAAFFLLAAGGLLALPVRRRAAQV